MGNIFSQIIIEANKTKVLMLSLGVGDIFGREQELTREEKREQILRGGIEPYKPTQYSYSVMRGGKNNDETIKSAFVAEPLLKMFKPDEIVIIGSAKSAWTSFFRAFGDDDELKNERMVKLFELEDNGGKDIDVVREDYAGQIETIYRDGITLREDFQNKKIHVIVTRYGMNGDELLENYSIISKKMASILHDRKTKYEIAFDITHSFRSMPIYNLAVLNYLQNTAMVDLEISHVYYGNLEVKYENRSIAPVLDLRELVNVMNLSGSVSEFKNTGNAVSILKAMGSRESLESSERELWDALEKFDLSTQLNASDMAIKNLKKLIEVCETGNKPGKYADLCKMILSVVQEKFFEDSGAENMNRKFEGMSLGEKQHRLAMWYYSQNRYGQAMATALEAVRSYLAKLYVEGNPMCPQDIKNQDNREAAMEGFKKLAKKCGSSNNELEEKICKFEEARRKAAPIRDMFAHNLDSGIVQKRTRENITWKEIKPTVDKFFDELALFVDMLHTDREAFKAAYIRAITERETRMKKIKTTSGAQKGGNRR